MEYFFNKLCGNKGSFGTTLLFSKNSLDCDGSSQVVFSNFGFLFFLKSLSKTTCLGADFLLGVCVTTP
jgi:hypothetical protein